MATKIDKKQVELQFTDGMMKSKSYVMNVIMLDDNTREKTYAKMMLYIIKLLFVAHR